jgi:hypothetical protein
MAELTVERLRALLDYNPLSGVFTWKTRTVFTKWDKVWNTRFAGKTAGGKSQLKHRKSPQWTIAIDNRKYLAHRLAWLHHYGVWPTLDVDHRDTDSCNNRIANLREATGAQNQANGGSHSHSHCGIKGVSFHKLTGRWMARIAANGKQHYLGLFDSADAARAAYAAAAPIHHGEFARLR